LSAAVDVYKRKLQNYVKKVQFVDFYTMSLIFNCVTWGDIFSVSYAMDL